MSLSNKKSVEKTTIYIPYAYISTLDVHNEDAIFGGFFMPFI